jgi:anti-anti-sigma regulatory factor
MAANTAPVFLVDVYSDPILVKVRGRASFQNSQLVRDFFQQAIGEGRRRFAVDFAECAGMDSTFLGVLAGAALELRKAVPAGSLVFLRLGARNLELVRNLGLHRLATVDPGNAGDGTAPVPAGGSGPVKPLEGPKLAEVESARLCLKAHENLIAADHGNLGKFQDVITILKNRVDQG